MEKESFRRRRAFQRAYSFAKRFGDEAGTNPERELIYWRCSRELLFDGVFRPAQELAKPDKIATTCNDRVIAINAGGGFSITPPYTSAFRQQFTASEAKLEIAKGERRLPGLQVV